MGGQPETFSGLAGMGDLLATCISSQSRNRHVGEELGKGKSMEQIAEEMNQVAEGVRTAKVVLELAELHGVDMPITAEVAEVVAGTAPAKIAYRGLLKRTVSSERH
jgi:glycerol-3-phosphate dehydrogenase (NAD(P)+)